MGNLNEWNDLTCLLVSSAMSAIGALGHVLLANGIVRSRSQWFRLLLGTVLLYVCIGSGIVAAGLFFYPQGKPLAVAVAWLIPVAGREFAQRFIESFIGAVGRSQRRRIKKDDWGDGDDE